MTDENSATRKIRILVVEDEAIVARDICLQLTELGHDPVADTPLAEEAIELAGKLRPDLILMDINLAGKMDGITAAKAIRERFELPVIFVTAFSGLEILKRAKEAGPYGYLIKPFAEQDLRTAIEMAIYKHHSEVQLRESEARLQTITNSARDAIIMMDPRGLITFWNPAAEKILGYRSDEALGQELHQLLSPERFRPAFHAAHPNFLRTGEGAAVGKTRELAACHKDGREIQVALSLSAVEIKGGWHAVGMIRDITAQKAAEEKMRLQSTALEATVNSVVITDTLGTIEWVNPAFCRITGYTFEEAIGQNPRVLKSGKQPTEYYTGMWRTITAGKNWTGEFINRRKDGTLYTESVSITPVKNESGQIAHFVAIKQDVTALKQSMADLSLAHTELLNKNVALDEALVEARAAAEAKSAFLSTMSHELRTPMNGVIGMASLLKDTPPLTDEQMEYIDTITSSGDTLLTLINDVLDFSKIEANHMEIERFPFDVRRCIDETLDIVGVKAREKHLDLAAEIDSSVPPAILGDVVRLRQVLTNLLGNAIKFTAKGEVVVELRCEPAPDGAHRLFFRVRDTGIGIPEDKIDRLFKLFSQMDSSTTRVYGGTGLGLAISQRLVGLMGGQIEVSSEPGAGSVFFFDFTTTGAEAIEPMDAKRIPQELADRSVLVVDDNETNRRIFSSQLSLGRCLTVEADSGSKALAWLKDHAWPDLIITDMLMPEMDGLDFTLNVRAMEAEQKITPPVPVILVSSGGYQPSDPRTAKAHLTAALSKPLRQAQLLEAAARACQVVPLRRAAVKTTAAGGELRTTAIEHPRRILLAEDNAVNRMLAKAMLGHLGYTADVAANGLLAVEACRRKTYDLILMDVQMPEMDGLEASRQVRVLPGAKPVIIAMTANAMEGDRDVCLAAGMDDYLSKPVKLDDLKQAIISSRPPDPPIPTP